MSRSWSVPRLLAALVACALSAAVVAGCGAGGSKPGGATGGGTTSGTDTGQGATRGGTLEVVSSQDIGGAGGLDPGSAYGGIDLLYLTATQRTLYAYEPGSPNKVVPDLAAGPPQVSDGGKTLTVKLRPGVRFSPPVKREVTAGDVKYAIERGFNPHVANPYAGTYYGSLVGARHANGGPIRGIATPDDHTVVLRFTEPVADLVVQAATLPLDAPVPPEYAKRFDAHAPSDYGAHQVSTGPYMIAADSTGKVTGYQPGHRLRLVRNPSWSASTDFRPAYVDAIDWTIGVDPTIGARQVLQGSHKYFADVPDAATVKLAYQKYRQQIFFAPGAGVRYIALNTAKAPFKDPNLRKALAAALDRTQMRLVRGGAVVGDVASHFLYPGVNGFDEAGGMAGTGDDFLANPSGDLAVARKYLKAAGYPGGKYTGGETVVVVGITGRPDDSDAQIVDRALRDLGFKTQLKLLDQSVMYGNFCAKPSADYDVCPNVGWVRDFADPQTVLDPAFNGAAIQPEGNPNWPQLDDPAINRAMAKGEVLAGEQERTRAWADVDRMVTATAAAIPWLWDKQPNVFSRDVRCVNELWNQGYCDFAFTSLK